MDKHKCRVHMPTSTLVSPVAQDAPRPSVRRSFLPSIHPISDPTTSRSVCLSVPLPFPHFLSILLPTAAGRRKEGIAFCPNLKSRESRNKKKEEKKEEENFAFSAYFVFPDFCHAAAAAGAFGTHAGSLFLFGSFLGVPNVSNFSLQSFQSKSIHGAYLKKGTVRSGANRGGGKPNLHFILERTLAACA